MLFNRCGKVGKCKILLTKIYKYSLETTEKPLVRYRNLWIRLWILWKNRTPERLWKTKF
jgi:hypothetical protein